MAELRIAGAGISGLLCALALRDFFDSVQVHDRGSRSGVKKHPYDGHVHVLLQQGYDDLAGLFPDFEEHCRRSGKKYLDWGKEFRRYFDGTAMPAIPFGGQYVFGRNFLHQFLAERCAADDRISFHPGSAISLDISGQLEMRTGTKVRTRTPGPADWFLHAGGSSDPPLPCGEVFLPHEFHYYSAEVKMPETAAAVSWEEGDGGFFRGAMLMPTGKTATVSAGSEADWKIRDSASLRSRLRTFGDDFFPRLPAVQGRIHHYFFRGNRMRIPDGWLPRTAVVGEALCMTNPVLGLGISSAIRHVLALRASLQSGRTDASTELLRIAEADMKLSADFRSACFSRRQPEPMGDRLKNALARRYIAVMPRSNFLSRIYLEVRNRKRKRFSPAVLLAVFLSLFQRSERQ